MKRIVALVLILSALLTACNTTTPPVSSEPAPPETSSESVESSVEEPLPEPEPESSEPELSSEDSSSSAVESESMEESSLSYAPPKQLTDVAVTPETIREQLSIPMEEIEALDNTAITWGPGPTSGEARPATPLQLQQQYGAYGAWFIAPDNGKIYITFDEGYEAGYDDQILDTLKEKDVSAIFFVTMGFVKSRPDLIQRMIDEGHTVGNHTWKHIPFPEAGAMDTAVDVMTLHQFILENYGYEMTLCRPPAGAFSKQSLTLLHELGYESVFWSFAYRDWLLDDQPNPTEAKETIVGRSHSGGIYLLHAVSKTNAEILGEVIDDLRAKGYELAPWDVTA